MPFGQLIESPNANDLSLLSIDGSSASTGGRVSSQLHNEDPLLRIRVDECISSGSGDQEVIYGTVRVQNNRILGSKAKLYLKLDECDLLNLMCSPNCRRSSRRQDLNCPTSTNDGRLQSSPNSNSDIPGSLNDIPIDQLQFDLHTDSPKYFHYLCDNRLFKPLLSYEFVVTRLDTTRRPGTSDRPGRTYSLRLRLELNVKPQSLKFVDFRVVFPEIRPESDRKLLNSHMNHGQLTVDRRGLSWQLDNRFPRTLQPELTMDVGCPDKDETQFAEAQLQFKTESLNYGLPRITSDRIRIENATRKPKMNIEFCLTTVNYKLIANFQ